MKLATQITTVKTRCQVALGRLVRYTSPPHNGLQFVSAASMSGLLLTLIAVLAAALGAWRLGGDPGWTSRFFIASGLFSRYQAWFAVATVAQTSAFGLNRWVANQKIDLPALAL